jgi:AraC-like DNA-binding protein
MSSVIRSSSGKSAGEWIDERTVLEVKTLLKTTGMTIQQIADELNFPTQSSFGRYFKRIVGTSPKEYRKK